MIDRYTKVCLTVIAVSLAVIGLKELPLVGPVWATEHTQAIRLLGRTFKATPVQCSEVKRVSYNWMARYIEGGHTSDEWMMRDLEKAEGFATIYNAFCKD